ncbi:MAG: hypothetical protein KJ852_04155 [Gammaproteobacteria bacterium]|nr:hypothetical protein [Gammaproteobacteria bacterium]MBU0786587.1 hypothetical protein [Gammaproteobacteria bacterium]MBU0814342.1 hypothetical protein [Gammaproteobacteria bacterium]MBU1786138.1 hypothetical protein [Gammaproteobacteria bacterium]
MKATAQAVTLPATAIDVGFFSTKQTLGRQANKDSSEILVAQFPSIAPRITGGLQSFSLGAEHEGVLLEVEPGVHHYVGKDVLNTSNSFGTRAVVSNFSESASYKALFLGALFYLARHQKVGSTLIIKMLAVGLPMSTIFSHSKSLQMLVTGEHTIPHPSNPGSFIQVVVQNAMVVAQPQGALINHGVSKYGKPSDMNSLVLDMGGGTFDWFVSKGIFPNKLRCGAAPIGALACATAVCSQIHPELQNDHEIMARVDAALSSGAETVRITGRDYRMADYWPAVRGVLQDAVEQMQKSVGLLRNIDTILLTGGGSRMLSKVIGKMLPDFAHMIEMDEEPVFSNVRGFHVIAERQAV